MSLRPIGTPWNGPRRAPFACSSSHAAACAAAASGRTVMYAWIFGSSASIRERIAPVSSREEISFCRTLRAASRRVHSWTGTFAMRFEASFLIFDDPRDAETVVLPVGGVREERLPVPERLHRVVAEGGARLDGVGRGDDVAGVEPVELLHVVEDRRELPAKAPGFRFRQRKARQPGDVQHLFPRDRHTTPPVE